MRGQRKRFGLLLFFNKSNFGLTLTYITSQILLKETKLKSFQGQITNEQIIKELRWLDVGQIQSEHKDLNF